jgi:hypothetical protein
MLQNKYNSCGKLVTVNGKTAWFMLQLVGAERLTVGACWRARDACKEML